MNIGWKEQQEKAVTVAYCCLPYSSQIFMDFTHNRAGKTNFICELDPNWTTITLGQIYEHVFVGTFG